MEKAVKGACTPGFKDFYLDGKEVRSKTLNEICQVTVMLFILLPCSIFGT